MQKTTKIRTFPICFSKKIETESFHRRFLSYFKIKNHFYIVSNLFLSFVKSPFLFLTLLFLLTAKGHIEIIDTEYSIRTAKIIIEDGMMLIDPVDSNNKMPTIPGTDKIYSQYGIGILAVFVPIVGIAKLLSIVSNLDENILTHFLLSFYNIPFAILALWHFRRILVLLNQKKEIATFFMICLAIGTIFWKYVVTDFSEITQIALLLGAVHSYVDQKNKKKWLFVSAYLGLLVLLKVVYIVVIPPFVILAIIDGRKDRCTFQNVLHGATFLLPSGLLIMCMNWIRYGSIFESGYGSAQSDFSFLYLQRDWKDYLISIDRGIITYSPIILLGIISVKRFYKNKSKCLFLIASICLTLYLLTASWIGWKGGYCWGNRNLVPIVPLLCLFWAFIDWKNLYQRITFLLLLIISFPIQIVAVSLKTHEWSVLSREFKDHPDPYYVPSELEGSAKIFCEKLTNTSGIYRADNFVNEHYHSINLTNYESFIGFNFWPVHACKIFDPSLVVIVGNSILATIIFGATSLIICFYPKPKKIF